MNVRDWIRQVIANFMPELYLGPRSFRYLLHKRATESSVDFVCQNMANAEPFDTKEALFRYVMKRMPEIGLIVECGVQHGYTINAIAALTKRPVHGFDSFEGLPDDGEIPELPDGRPKWYVGKMSRSGEMPAVKDNVQLHKGWFEATLPTFFGDHAGTIALLHVDCDIYSSTKCVLDCARERLVQGTIIIFDEYLNYEGWQRHEHRALTEFAATTGLQYEFVAYTYRGGVAVKITKPPTAR